MKRVRVIPIDFRSIAKESGMSKGKLCKPTVVREWCVMREDAGGIECAVITPPKMLEGEKELRIEGRNWAFYA